MSEIEVVEASSPASPGGELAQFESALVSAMSRLALPTDGVLVEFVQRQRVFDGFPTVIEDLDDDRRARSLYLSKFLVAVGAGLFDAALNYLWDETIGELRRRIADYDLSYFFDVAVQSPERRKSLRDVEDLAKVADDDLMKASMEIGLISDVGFKQLDVIRYMRNHASAAHPNHNDIRAHTLLGWVEVCITEVITLPETPVVAEIRRILGNVKSKKLTAEQASDMSTFFGGMPSDQADNLCAGLFGIFTELDTNEATRDNVRLLLPYLWPFVTEAQRQKFGVKLARFLANGDIEQAQFGRDLFNLLNANSYLPEEARVSEIADAIDDLLSAHRGFDNFYNEGPRVRALASVIGDREVPAAVRKPYVRSLVEAFLSNGHGIAASADDEYVDLFGRFGRQEAELALFAFTDPTISNRLARPLCQQKWTQLLGILNPKITTPRVRELFDAVAEFTGSPDKLANDTKIARLTEEAAQHISDAS